MTAKGWRAEGTKPVKRIGIGLLDNTMPTMRHADHADLSSETSFIKPLCSYFSEKVGKVGKVGKHPH